MADNVLPMHRPGRGRGASDPGPLFTVKDVADASGLPQPAISQLVGSTWTDQGRMFTADQMQMAVDIAAELRRQASADGAGDEATGRFTLSVAEEAHPRPT
ncbi:hypothetical protein [Mycobacterium sp. NPDC006124]|uniref:hypothetical protein n=1 Tax=Mycobacterium sp. NPDC006124 TaxID=3156729 RepID=UPI0033BAF171